MDSEIHPASPAASVTGLAASIDHLESIAPKTGDLSLEFRARLGRPPTVGEMAEEMARRTIDGAHREFPPAIARLGSGDPRLRSMLEEAYRQIVSNAEGARTVREGAAEPYDPANPTHVKKVRAPVSKFYGEVGELMLAVRLPGLIRRGMKIGEVEPSSEELNRLAGDAVRQLEAGPKTSLQARLEERRRQKGFMAGLKPGSAEFGQVRLSEEEAREVRDGYPQWVRGQAMELARKQATQAALQEIRRKLSAEFTPEEVRIMMDKEIDLVFDGGKAWGEVKNYEGVMDAVGLQARKPDSRGRPGKSILDQAIENARLGKALHGVDLVVHQFVVVGITRDAATLLVREVQRVTGQRLVVHGIVGL